MSMTPEQQRIALAEWAGWQDIYRCGASLSRTKNGEAHGKRIAGTMDLPSINYGREYQEIPNYPKDLNAVHELEKRLDANSFKEFRHQLYQITKPEEIGLFRSERHERAMLSATAAQRCEALLKALNLWKP